MFRAQANWSAKVGSPTPGIELSESRELDFFW